VVGDVEEGHTVEEGEGVLVAEEVQTVAVEVAVAFREDTSKALWSSMNLVCALSVSLVHENHKLLPLESLYWTVFSASSFMSN